jgi:amino acid transporter
MLESPQKSPQHSGPESEVYGQEKKSDYVAENLVYAADEGLGENEEYGEVKELR